MISSFLAGPWLRDKEEDPVSTKHSAPLRHHIVSVWEGAAAEPAYMWQGLVAHSIFWRPDFRHRVVPNRTRILDSLKTLPTFLSHTADASKTKMRAKPMDFSFLLEAGLLGFLLGLPRDWSVFQNYCWSDC